MIGSFMSLCVDVFFQEHQSAVREVEELQAQLSRHKHQLQQTAQELEQLRKA